jgi:hypothetical protein
LATIAVRFYATVVAHRLVDAAARADLREGVAPRGAERAYKQQKTRHIRPYMCAYQRLSCVDCGSGPDAEEAEQLVRRRWQHD